MKIVILIYDNEQVKRVGQVIREHQNKQNEVLVVALRADVEITLKEVGIPFISSREFRSVDPVERYAFSEELVTPLFHSKKFDFWSFQNIDFQTLYQPLLQTYLAELLYWIDMIDGIMATHAPQRIVTWDSANIAAIGNVLSVKNSKVVTDAVFVVSNQKSISCDIRSVGNVFVLHNTMFRFKRLLFIFSIFIWNFAITVFKKPKSVRLIVSDIWRNSAPYIKEIPEAEVVVWDRSEIKNINFSTLLKNRMRFFHANTFRTYKSKKQAQRQIILLNNQWIKERDDFFKKLHVSFLGYNLSPILGEVFDMLVLRGSKEAVFMISDVQAMLLNLKPHAVIVRASASGQVHFPVLCLIAKQLSIPSFEPQHGLFYLGPASVPKYSQVEYLATYGPLASSELHTAGYKGITHDIGSPRFDVYSALTKNRQSPHPYTALFVVPDDTTGQWFDTYEIIDLFKCVEDITKQNININIILKVRAGSKTSNFAARYAAMKFINTPQVQVARTETLAELFKKTDVVVSVFSTIILEALAANIPTIYLGSALFHRAIEKDHMYPYYKDEVVMLAHSCGELTNILSRLQSLSERDSIKNRIKKFNLMNFTFISGASKRFANLIQGKIRKT